MKILRLRVEEGFFNLLDLHFTDGLNVMIGGRGVGKTSIIELLRFGLGITNLSEIASRESTAHAVSILQSSGRVVIDININGQVISVTRSASDTQPINASFFTKPLIFSQKEIETISLNSTGRLNLIDSFIMINTQDEQSIKALFSEIKSLCSTLTLIRREYDEAIELAHQKSALIKQEKELLEQQAAIDSNYPAIQKNQYIYTDLQSKIDDVNLEINGCIYLLDIFKDRVKSYESLNHTTIDALSNSPNFISLLNQANSLISEENNIFAQVINKDLEFIKTIEHQLNTFQTEKNSLESQSREYRNEISKVTENAGSILSKLSIIREQLSAISNWDNIATLKKSHLDALYIQIQDKLNSVNEFRIKRFKNREAIANWLNISLAPYVRTEVIFSSDISDYVEELKQSLKGSGLKYNEIVHDVASKIHPQWLFYYVQSGQFDEFSKILNMPLERAVRLLSYLREVDLGSILSCNINDEAIFYLLDKGSYKKIDELSIGQRCTVALSIILENRNRVLVIDQPEDHLDNEFIANTLIPSLVKRSPEAQTILSSHNANIPVLGNANMVINLDSNGRKGFIKHSGSIEQPEIKFAIENIMEGGREAFMRRSNFYIGA